MKSATMLLTFVAAFAVVSYAVTQLDMPQAWARQSGAKSGASSRVIAPPANTGVSQGTDVQAKKKKPSRDQLEYMKYEMKDALITN